MPRRRPALAVLALTGAVSGALAAAAAADPLPLGPATLSETRTTRTVAPGVTETGVARAAANAGETWVVDAGFTLAPTQAAQTAVRIRELGLETTVIGVDAHAPDSPLPGPVAYVARAGRFATEQAADAAAAGLKAAGVADAQPDYTGDDGTPVAGGPWRVHVLDIDPRRFRGRVAPVLSNGVVRGRAAVTAIARRARALAGAQVTRPSDPTGERPVGDAIVLTAPRAGASR